MKVHVASITHKHGGNLYAALTRDNLIKQIAEYCRREYDGAEPLPDNNYATIDSYFAWISEIGASEWIEIEEIEAL